MSTGAEKKSTFDIFTRMERGDDLVHIGTVEAESVELAKVYATFTYNEEDWTEMCIVKREDLQWVRKTEGLFSKRGA